MRAMTTPITPSLTCVPDGVSRAMLRCWGGSAAPSTRPSGLQMRRALGNSQLGNGWMMNDHNYMLKICSELFTLPCTTEYQFCAFSLSLSLIHMFQHTSVPRRPCYQFLCFQALHLLSHLTSLHCLPSYRQSGGGVKPNKQKYSYQRPAFLKLATEDEIQVFVTFLQLYLLYFSM